MRLQFAKHIEFLPFRKDGSVGNNMHVDIATLGIEVPLVCPAVQTVRKRGNPFHPPVGYELFEPFYEDQPIVVVLDVKVMRQ